MNEKIKKLEKELKFLKKEVIEEEIKKHRIDIENNADIKKLANDIYSSRGIDTEKLNRNITGNLINNLNLLYNGFKNKEKNIKIKMIIDLLIMFLIIVLIKIPFDLIRDIGYEYIEIISTNSLFYAIWNLLFLIIYTIVIICSFVILLKNFNNKYNN